MVNDVDRRAAERLRDAWDDLNAGRPLPSDAFDPSLNETIDHLHVLYRPQVPDPVFIELLGQALMPESPPSGVQPPLVHPPHGHTARKREESSFPLPPGAGRQRLLRALSGLAAAALIALVLLTGIVILRAGRQTLEQGAPLPAVDGIEATVAPAATIETLFTTTLPAAQVPETGVVQFFVWRLAIDPQTSTPATPEGSCCQGPQLTHVLSGELTVHGDGPIQVFRGSDQILVAPGAPGSDVVLLPGDTVIHDFSRPSEYANHGTTPAEIVNAGLYAGTALPFWSPAVRFLDGSQEFHQSPFPPGPVVVNLLQATLPPNGVFPAPPPGSLDLEVGQDGDASVGKNGDGSFFNIAETDQTIYAVVVEPGGRGNLTP